MLNLTVYCYQEPHEYFVSEEICTVQSIKAYEGFFKIIGLTCDWVKFVDAEDKAPELEGSNSKTQSIYEIKFTEIAATAEFKYISVRKNFLRDFKVRSLTLSRLGLVSVDEHAFDKKNFGLYLEKLDLSENSLQRLDSHVLQHADQLQHLNLAKNRLKFSENNFFYNIHLRILDLSGNHFQFLTPNLFGGLVNLERVDLRDNNIRDVKACVLNNIQENTLSRKFSPVLVNLEGNPVVCDCDLFYLERHLGYKIEATCAKPNYYKDRKFSQLKNEDPEYRCHYSEMNASCERSSVSDLYLGLIIGFACLAGILLFITFLCHCSNSSKNSKIRQLNDDLQSIAEKKKPKKIYANFSASNVNKKSADAQALIEH